MSIDDILTGVLKREGWPAVTNRPSDTGGLTKGGVTFTSYNAWRVKHGQPPTTPTDFASVVTEDEARAFMLDEIAGPFMVILKYDPRLFTLMVDWAETSGPDDPVRALQGVMRTLGIDVTVDGVYGSKTDTGIRHNLHLTDDIRKLVAAQRIQFYVKLALADPEVRLFRVQNPNTNLENVLGWVNRASEFL